MPYRNSTSHPSRAALEQWVLAVLPTPPMDIQVENHFSLFLLRPLSDTGREWLDSHVADDAQWFGNALVVEPRYVSDIVQGAIDDGLAVR